MKTKEELNKLKEEAKALAGKLEELSDDELTEIAGGEDLDSWVRRMKEKLEDYYSNSNNPIEELPSHLLPGVDPSIIDKIIDLDKDE